MVNYIYVARGIPTATAVSCSLDGLCVRKEFLHRTHRRQKRDINLRNNEHLWLPLTMSMYDFVHMYCMHNSHSSHNDSSEFLFPLFLFFIFYFYPVFYLSLYVQILCSAFASFLAAAECGPIVFTLISVFIV